VIEYSMFNRLPTWSQVEVLVKNGTVIALRQHNDWSITLFSINEYFVELWSNQHLQVVGSFHETAKPLDILEPYLVYMDVPDLN